MPVFIRLVESDKLTDIEHELQKPENYYFAAQRNFQLIQGNPIAYWVKSFSAFTDQKTLNEVADLKVGLQTGSNDQFLRLWFEIASCSFNRQIGVHIGKWYPYSKGGEFRKWYGNNDYVIDWHDDGIEIKNFRDTDGKLRSRPQNTSYYFKEAVEWSDIGQAKLGARLRIPGFHFDVVAMSLFPRKTSETTSFLAYLNSACANYYSDIVVPGMHANTGYLGRLPFIKCDSPIGGHTGKCLSIAKSDWDIRETSWDFLRSPLVTDYSARRKETQIYENLIDWSWPSALQPEGNIDLPAQARLFAAHWQELFITLQQTEEELNRIFIDLYGLQSELSPIVPNSEITILQEEVIESSRAINRIKINESTLAEQFMSYGVGCICGRYSVEMDGLILADGGGSIEAFKGKIPSARFLPDDDGILPLTDEDDFIDDLPTAFKAWLRYISGAQYDSNLSWIEKRIGKDSRSYFDRDFYKDHLRRYKSRPIYWMVSSPSGAFRALIYLHRYTKDTIGKILNDYVRPYRAKIDQKIRGLESVMDSSGSSAGEKTKAKKRLAQLQKYRTEIETWEKESLYPLALKRVELDLDDGVKVNYRKLEGILEPVKQLEGKEEE